jgi:hypothetical protein
LGPLPWHLRLLRRNDDGFPHRLQDRKPLPPPDAIFRGFDGTLHIVIVGSSSQAAEKQNKVVVPILVCSLRAPVLAIAALDLPRCGRNRLAHLADELDWALVEADHRAFRIGHFGVEIEHIVLPRTSRLGAQYPTRQNLCDEVLAVLAFRSWVAGIETEVQL